MKPARAKPRKPAIKRATAARAPQPNLIITIDERHRKRASAEIKNILTQAGLKGHLTKAPGQGLIGVYLQQDPRACIGILRERVGRDPFAFQHTHRWLPIEQWSRAQAQEVSKFAQRAGAEIQPTETWAIKAERHSSQLEPSPLVNALAGGIDHGRVDLESPDKTVLLEIVGQRAGMAVVNADQMLSIDQEMKRFVKFEEVR